MRHLHESWSSRITGMHADAAMHIRGVGDWVLFRAYNLTQAAKGDIRGGHVRKGITVTEEVPAEVIEATGQAGTEIYAIGSTLAEGRFVAKHSVVALCPILYFQSFIDMGPSLKHCSRK